MTPFYHQVVPVIVADISDKAVINLQPHEGLAVDDFPLMDYDFLNERVQKFGSQFGNVGVPRNQFGELPRSPVPLVPRAYSNPT